MKKISSIAVALLFCSVVSSQSFAESERPNKRPTYFLWFDSQFDFSKERQDSKFSQNAGSPGFYLWGSATMEKWGISFNAFHAADGLTEFSVGPVLSAEGPKKDTYYEFNASVGLSTPKKMSAEDPLVFLTSGYIYAETKSYERVYPKKLITLIYGAYYLTEPSWWYRGYAVYFPVKFLGVGAHVEQNAAVGLRTQLAVRIKKTGVFNVWFVGGLNKKIAAGANYSFVF